MQHKKVNQYKKEKNKIISQVNKLNKSRENLIKKIKKANSLYIKNKLSADKYNKLINKILNKKSFDFWLNNNSEKTEKLERKLYVINAKIKGAKKTYIYQELFIAFFALLFSLTYFYLDSSITGLTVLELPIFLNETTPINLEENITSLRLTGYLEGNGIVKVYLDNYLVLDSTFFNISQNKIPSQNNENNESGEINTNDLFTIQPVETIKKIEFNEVCIETCDAVKPVNNILKAELNGQINLVITNINYTIEEINLTETNNKTDNQQENLTNFSIPLAPVDNLTQPIQNVSINNLTLENSTLSNLSTENITIQNTTFLIENLSEKLIQVKAEINKPVEWKLTTKNKSIELPLEAINITVEKIINETEKEKAKLKNLFSSTGISEKKLIEVDESNETELEVTYYTKAPYLVEYNLTEINEKIIKNFTVKSDSELHYSNVLSYIDLPEIFGEAFSQKGSNKEQIKLYHFIFNNLTNETEKIEITTNTIYNLTFEDINNNSLIDKLYFNVPQLSEQNFSLEISLTILTIQSYPTVGGNWTVIFNTTGTADLTVKASNGTTWIDNYANESVDLEFLEIKCENNIQNYTWINDSVFIPDYSCNETSTEISKVITIGKHTLEFTFGDIIKYAYNIANVLNLTLNSPLNATVTTNLSVTLNITQEGNITKLIIYGGNSTTLDYNNILYVNYSITGVQANNITYNFSALPIKPTGTDGLVLLHHYDNASSSENYTFFLDYSNSQKALNNGTYIRWNLSQLSLGNSTNSRFGLSPIFNGINNYIQVNNSASLQILQNITLAAWIKFDYNFTNYSNIYSNISSQGVIDKGDYGLYFDYSTGTLNFKLDNASSTSIKTSYAGSQESFWSMRDYNGYLYAGQGSQLGDGDIYYCNPASNSAGDVNICDSNEWSLSYDGAQEYILTLEEFNGHLYAGQGADAGDGDIFVCYANNTGNVNICDGTSDWVISNNSGNNQARTLKSYNGYLYAGVYAVTAGTGDILICQPNTTGDLNVCDNEDWRISYDGAQEIFFYLNEFNGHLYAGQGLDAGDGDIFVCEPERNTTNLGEGLRICDPDEWSLSYNSAYAEILTITKFNGRLYAGHGSGTNGDDDLAICRPELTGNLSLCDTGDWAVFWQGPTTIERIFSLSPYNGKLYISLGDFTASSGGADLYICNPASTANVSDCDSDDIFLYYDGTAGSLIKLFDYKNKLYIGQGNEFTGEGDIYIFGNSEIVNSTTTTWNPNQWYHIAGVYNGTTMKLFVNGKEENTKHTNMTIEQNMTNLFIGYDSSYGYFNGTIDEVAIYNRSLSQLEISNLYNLTYGKYYWKANATDLANNVNNTGIFEFNIDLSPSNANTTIRPIIPVFNNSLNCSFTFLDPNPDDSGIGTIIWYNNSREHFRVNISIATPGNNTIVSYQLNYNNTNNFTSGQNWTCAARTNDLIINSDDWVNASVVINNTVPHNPRPYIFPNPARTNSSLNSSSIIIDPDANDVRTVEIQLYNSSRLHFRANITDVVNGSNLSYTLTENQTNKFSKGENWTAAFRVYDGINLSDWINASILISNTQPENPNTTIRPSSPIKTDSLNCSFTYIDTNNDAGTASIIWYNNSLEHFRTNISIANNSNNTIVSYTLTRNTTNAFLRSETWTCAAIVNDGVINSNWINASVTIQNIVPNNATPYIFASPFTSNTVIRTNNSLNASSFVSDQDADNMTVEIVFWNGTREHFRINRTNIGNASNISYTLTENQTNKFSKGENWTAAFKVTDNSSASSDWINASILISNTQPENPNTTIRPSSPIKTDNLNCSFTYIDTNNDAGTASIIWYNNSLEHFRTNISIANNSNNTIVSYTLVNNATNIFLGNRNWICAARFTDNNDTYSSWFNASVLLPNIAPDNATPFIFPNPAYKNSSLNASSFVSDPDANLMTVEIVFWNGTREHFRTNLTNVANNSNISYTLVYNQTINFTKNQNWTASFRVNDGNISSDWINASVVINNTAPILSGTISNSTFNEDTNLTNVTDLDDSFSDIDNDTLTYTASVSGGITVQIDSFNIISYLPSSNWFGTATVNITASDGSNSVKSNIITVKVNNVEEAIETIAIVSGKTTKLIGLDILVPSPVSISLDDKVILPIIIRNDKSIVLTNIKLSAQPSSDQLSPNFKSSLIPVLSPGQQEILDLEIKSSKTIIEDRYSIIISASTAEGASDSAEFFVNVAEFGSANRTILLPRLQVARDLFKSNPQCLELSELLRQAEQAIKEKQFAKSESLIENAIKGCNDLISFIPEKIETQIKKPRQNIILLIEFISLILLVTGIIFYRKYRRNKFI